MTIHGSVCAEGSATLVPSLCVEMKEYFSREKISVVLSKCRPMAMQVGNVTVVEDSPCISQIIMTEVVCD